MTGPDCAVMCNLINTHPHPHTRTHTHTHLVQRLHEQRGVVVVFSSPVELDVPVVGQLGHGLAPERFLLWRCHDTTRRDTDKAE